MAQAAATAIYNDTWAGKIPVSLLPARSTRQSKRVTIYRWVANQGYVNAGGFIAKQNAAHMIASASRHPSFSDVVAL